MKKLFAFALVLVCAVMVSLFFAPFSHADFIQDVLSEHVITQNLEAKGNVVVNGSQVSKPNLTYTSLSNTTTLNPYGKRFIVVNGTGNITMASTPHISTQAASNGQELILTGGTNTVDFVDEGTLTGSLMELGSSSRTLNTGDMLHLIYYSGKWYEVSFINN